MVAHSGIHTATRPQRLLARVPSAHCTSAISRPFLRVSRQQSHDIAICAISIKLRVSHFCSRMCNKQDPVMTVPARVVVRRDGICEAMVETANRVRMRDLLT